MIGNHEQIFNAQTSLGLQNFEGFKWSGMKCRAQDVIDLDFIHMQLSSTVLN